jgi:hypothetical protein
VNEQYFLSIYHELIDENPFAARAVLKILDVTFSQIVPTLAVTCEDHPRLLVNLDFVAHHCRTEAQVKAVITHEFLHVLLRHTEQPAPFTKARHIAFDAVINAIIHRTCGPNWSSLMSEYYADATGIARLLRPYTDKEIACLVQTRGIDTTIGRAWLGLYGGRLVADDIAQLADDLLSGDPAGQNLNSGLSDAPGQSGLPDPFDGLLGNHEDIGKQSAPQIEEALQQVLREMNGNGIWRSQPPGNAAHLATLEAEGKSVIRHWERETLAILKRHLQPDRAAKKVEYAEEELLLPVLSTRDRRAFVRATWDPILPQARWITASKQRIGTAQVYLDVSGSMSEEMPQLIALLGQLSTYVRRPFWAFSNEVAPARIEQGRLITQTTGGTSMACVLRHVIDNRPAAAVIVTDGFIERVNPGLVKDALSRSRIHVIVSRHGSPAELRSAGLPYTQLKRFPS